MRTLKSFPLTAKNIYNFKSETFFFWTLQFMAASLDTLVGTLRKSGTDHFVHTSRFMGTLLSYGENAKKSQLTLELFYKYDASRMEETIIEEAGGRVPNSVLQKRREFVARSQEFDMIGRIHGDIFFQDRYMLNELNS